MAMPHSGATAYDDIDIDKDYGSDDEEDVPWECIDELVRGAPLLKFGRQGDPHFRQFALDTDCKYLTWVTHKKKTAESRVLLANCGLIEGQNTDVFRRQPRKDLEDVSFSLLYEDPKKRGVQRTLDVVCKDRREYESWVTALRYLIRGSPPSSLIEARKLTIWGAVGDDGDGGKDASSVRRVTMNITRTLKKRMKDKNDVYVFGTSAWGQGGLGDELPHPAAALNSALLGKVIKAVSCGSAHTLALAESGECYAFGNGGSGRLGTGSTEHELSPRLLVAPSAHKREPYRFVSVGCGDMHSLAIDSEGTAYSWGCNARGQLGTGDDVDRLIPTPVNTFVTVIASVGGADGAIDAVINSSPSKQLLRDRRDSFSSSRSVVPRTIDWDNATLLPTRATAVSVAGGSCFSAFLDSSGRIFTCGAADAPLGHDRAHVTRLFDRMDVAMVDPHSALAYSSLKLFCDSHRSLDKDKDLHVPLQVYLGFDNPREQCVAVSCGSFHAGAVTSMGNCWMWGWNATGALGLGDAVDRLCPTKVMTIPKDVVTLSCGGSHTLAISQDRGDNERRLYCWGSSVYGQTPLEGQVSEANDAMNSMGTLPAYCTIPRMVELPNVSQRTSGPRATPRFASAGAFHSMVITDDGTLFAFGDGSSGALGIVAGALPETVKRVRKAKTTSEGGTIGSSRSFRSGFERIRSLGGLRTSLSSSSKRPESTSPIKPKTPFSTPSEEDMKAKMASMSLPPMLASVVESETKLDASDSEESVSVIHTSNYNSLDVDPVASPIASPTAVSARPAVVSPLSAQTGHSGFMSPIPSIADVLSSPRKFFGARLGLQSDADVHRDCQPASIKFVHHYFPGRPLPWVEKLTDAPVSAEAEGIFSTAQATQKSISAQQLDCRRPPSPTSVPEYRSGTYGSAVQDKAFDLLDEIDSVLQKPAFSSAPPVTLFAPEDKPGSDSRGPLAGTPEKHYHDSSPGMNPAASSAAAVHSPIFSMRSLMPLEMPISSTVSCGPLPVLSLQRKEVRTIACGNGFTVCTVATEWIDDEEAPNCMKCDSLFTVTKRRHHCRNCGGIFCDRCSNQRLPLLKLGHIEPVRVCDGCFARLQQE